MRIPPVHRLAPIPAGPEFSEFCDSLRLQPDLGGLLWNRGIRSFEAAKTFFLPEASQLHDPWQMPDMKRAVDRLVQAMTTGEKIRFYGDYDVDGTTSVALMVNHFKKIYQYPKIDFYIPDRYKEGYGISEIGIRDAVEQGVHVMVALDCGIKAHNTLGLAQELGLDVVVCDHHLPGDTLPPALAILNPKRGDAQYPWKELSGCGVAFKLISALNEALDKGQEGIPEALQLTAISTCCDIVDIRGENRILTALGLKELNERPLPGLAGIMKMSGLNREFRVEDVVFVIGPRINAAGRIGHGSGAVTLLTLDQEEDGLFEALKEIDGQNQTRKTLDKSITQEALALIDQPDDFTTVVHHPEWHKGVVGIVASRLIESVYRPTIVLTTSDGKMTGSARSIPGFDIYEAIASCGALLENFGGHPFAAGLTLLPEHLPAFQERFEHFAQKHLRPEDLVPKIDIDAEIPLERIQPVFWQVLQRMAPFGPGHLNPVFVSRNVDVVPHSIKIYKGDTLKFDVKTKEANPRYFEAIGFKMADKEMLLKQHNQVDLIYAIHEKSFNGKISLQISLKDLHVSEKL
jgi:single-stranded-DNA-specific exonuclease